MGSIRRRLLLASLLVLAVFLGATAVALDRAYRDSAEGALRARLKTDIFALLSTAELRSGELVLPQDLPESRLEVPGSGRYAEVSDADGKVLWSSPSSLGLHLPFVRGLAPGREAWSRVQADGEQLLTYSFGIGWEVQGAPARQFTFSVAARLDELAAEIGQFETTLMLWLGGAAALLLLMQMLILHWGLRPLRQVTADLKVIERGERDDLGGRYPRELAPLIPRPEDCPDPPQSVPLRSRAARRVPGRRDRRRAPRRRCCRTGRPRAPWPGSAERRRSLPARRRQSFRPPGSPSFPSGAARRGQAPVRPGQ